MTPVAFASIASGLFGAERCIAGQLPLGFSALALSVAGLGACPIWHDDAADPPSDRASAAPAMVVLAALIFFRCYRLVPPGLWGDDAINGLLAYDVLDGVVTSPFQLVRHSHSYFHALTNYAIAGSFYVFGASLTTLRLPGIAAGCVTGMAVYGIARQLFGRATAVFCGLLFAAAPVEIAHSKSLTQVVFGLMFQTTAVVAFIRGLQPRRTAWLVAAAVPLAATIYTYHAAKIAPLVLLPLVVAEWRRHGGNRRGLLWAGLVFALCLLPAAQSYWQQPIALTGRAQGVSLMTAMRESGSLRPLALSVAHTLGIFHVEQGPKYHWFGPGHDPALTLIAAALVLHGLVLSLRRRHQLRHQLLLFWFAIGLAPAILSTGAPRGYRALLATPPIFIWVALPLSALWRNGAADRLSRAALKSLAGGLIVASLVFDYNYYFYRTYTHPGARWTLGERLVELARIVRDAGPGWTGYVMSPTFSAQYESTRLLSRMWQLDLVDTASLRDAVSIDPLPARGAIFLTAHGSDAANYALHRYYRRATLHPRYDPAPKSWQWGGFWPYEPMQRRPYPVILGLRVPRQSLARARQRAPQLPLEVTCETEGRTATWREVLPFYSFFADTFPALATCRWSAALIVPPERPIRLHFTDNVGLEVSVDGTLYDDAKLAPGAHRIVMQGRIPRRRLKLRVSWEGPGGERELIPPAAWESLAPTQPPADPP